MERNETKIRIGKSSFFLLGDKSRNISGMYYQFNIVREFIVYRHIQCRGKRQNKVRKKLFFLIRGQIKKHISTE